uniref:ATP synthase F0 subunit 8 n=1 Tax=Trissolcus japonicus TaxID=1388796 RepID=A0A8E7UER9_9HYME|nr:ATP synthase F0 subunit 8 [Trissolcus japonicus]
MPQMSPTWWLILFTFFIKSFMLIISMIYFQWSPFTYLHNKYMMKKKFLLNDKNF